jgi:hypothetical protein
LKLLPSTRRELLLGVLLVVIASTCIIFAFWLLGIRMPGRNPPRASELPASVLDLRNELEQSVRQLAGVIGERNLEHYRQLDAAADFIERSFRQAGLEPRRDGYEVRGRAVHNIEAEIRGESTDIVLVGAHYDSASGTPGANDNATGVAALLALAQRFAGRPGKATLRFVAFVNEESPYFQTPEMGSMVYATRSRQRGDRIVAMISLETIGYFSDEPSSQSYPLSVLDAFYPKTGNFIGIVGNLSSRSLVRRAIATFREEGKIPAEGAALPAAVAGVGWSDHWAFWQNGYRAIMITDTALFRYPHYHRETDTPDKLDYDRFALVVSSTERAIASLASGVR